MAMVTTARQYLEAITEQALRYYDVEGNSFQAVASFLNDARKNDETSYIYSLPGVRNRLLTEAIKGRDSLKEAMLGFEVN